MKKHIRLAVTFLLMLCFCISALLYLFFDVAQLDLKAAAKDHMEEGAALQKITLSVREFRNDKEDELWHDGVLYDIRSYETVNDSVIVTVFRDDKEAALVKSISVSFDQNERCSSDDFFHICKNRVHIFNGGKILTSPYQVKLAGDFYKVFFLIVNFNSYPAIRGFEVIKPPPRYITV